MTEEERKFFVSNAIKDFYHEFNHSVNNLLILRDFFLDLLNVIDGKEPNFETKSNLNRNNK